MHLTGASPWNGPRGRECSCFHGEGRPGPGRFRVTTPSKFQIGAPFAMEDTSWDHGLEVTADGNGLVGHAGGILPRKLADQCGLTAALEAALTLKGRKPQLSRGMVLVSTAIAIAMGATAMADIAVLGQLAPVLGAAPSASTAR